MYGRSNADTTRVLVVSENEALATELSHLLESQGPWVRVYWVAAPELAATRARDVLPDLIFIDDKLGGADPIFVVREVRAAAADTNIVMLLEPSALRVAQSALLAGASTFLTKPIESHDLFECTSVLRSSAPTPRATIDGGASSATHMVVVLAAARGGMGRTVIASNLAVALHGLSNKPVILVDANLDEPAADVILNLRADFDMRHLVRRLPQIDHELLHSVLIPHESGIKVLQAPPWELMREPLSPPQIEEILGQLKRVFTWVVVDLGLITGEETLTYLDSADMILTVLQPEMTSVRGAHTFVNVLLNEGYSPDKMRLVLNRHDMAGGLAPQVISDYLPLSINYQVPDDQPLVSQSINRGTPVVISHERSAVAKAIMNMATTLSADLAPRQVTESAPATNPLGRLFRQAQLRSALARNSYVNPRQ